MVFLILVSLASKNIIKMIKVALAGGTGSLGRYIFSALETHPTKKYNIIILSRSPQPDLAARGISIQIVDYNSLDSLTAALSGVDIVISTLAGEDAVVTRNSQLLLIEAAKFAGVRRFAPSEWAISIEANKTMALYDLIKTDVWEAVKISGMQYTAFRPGIFMNYLAYESPKPGVMEEVFQSMGYFPFVVDIAKGTADIPGTGNEKVNFTLTQDVGRLVASSLDQDEVWEREENGMAGSIITYNELVTKIERITGKLPPKGLGAMNIVFAITDFNAGRKLNVRYESIPYLEQKIAEESTVMGKFYLEAKIAIAKGQAYVEPILNKNVSDMRPTGVAEFLEKWWGKDE